MKINYFHQFGFQQLDSRGFEQIDEGNAVQEGLASMVGNGT